MLVFDSAEYIIRRGGHVVSMEMAVVRRNLGLDIIKVNSSFVLVQNEDKIYIYLIELAINNKMEISFKDNWFQ